MASSSDSAPIFDESVSASVLHEGAAKGDAAGDEQPNPALVEQASEFFACPHAHLGRAHGKSCRCVLCCFVCSQADSFSPTRMCLTHGELVPVDQLSFCTGATSWHPAMVPAAGAERRG